MNISEIIALAIEKEASDIFLIAGLPVTLKAYGEQLRIGEEKLVPDSIATLVNEIYDISGREKTNLENHVDDDFSFSISQFGQLS